MNCLFFSKSCYGRRKFKTLPTEFKILVAQLFNNNMFDLELHPASNPPGWKQAVHEIQRP